MPKNNFQKNFVFTNDEVYVCGQYSENKTPLSNFWTSEKGGKPF